MLETVVSLGEKQNETWKGKGKKTHALEKKKEWNKITQKKLRTRGNVMKKRLKESEEKGDLKNWEEGRRAVRKNVTI